jgi:hypothetical protein
MKEQIKFTVRSLSGPAEYNLEPLTRKESLEIFHTVSEIFVSGLGEIVTMFTHGKDFDEKAMLDISKALDFDKVYKVGSAVLRSSVIVNEIGKYEIEDLEKSDYFDDRPEEFYLALAHAVKGNWPRLFFGIALKLRGFGDSEKFKDIMAGLLQKFQIAD